MDKPVSEMTPDEIRHLTAADLEAMTVDDYARYVVDVIFSPEERAETLRQSAHMQGLAEALREPKRRKRRRMLRELGRG